MAWWTTQLIFQGDTLIAEGVDPLPLEGYEVGADFQSAPGPPPGRTDLSPSYTRVIVSGYALYGQLRGYYALGVAHWRLEAAAGRVYLSEASQRHAEPVASLTAAQQAVVRDFLMQMNPAAWEASSEAFRKQLMVNGES